jgi:hypothetical protein
MEKMKTIVVPNDMLEVARLAALSGVETGLLKVNELDRGQAFRMTATVILEAALRWMDGELEKLWDSYNQPFGSQSERAVDLYSAKRNGQHEAIQEIRRMFLAPEPEVPEEEIKDLLAHPTPEDAANILFPCVHFNQRIREGYLRGYRRGKEAK